MFLKMHTSTVVQTSAGSPSGDVLATVNQFGNNSTATVTQSTDGAGAEVLDALVEQGGSDNTATVTQIALDTSH